MGVECQAVAVLRHSVSSFYQGMEGVLPTLVQISRARSQEDTHRDVLGGGGMGQDENVPEGPEVCP